MREEEINLHADEVMSLSQYRADEARCLVIDMQGPLEEARLPRVMGVLSKAEGGCSVHVRVTTPCGSRVELDTGMAVTPTEALMVELEEVLSDAELRFAYPRNGNVRNGATGSRTGNGNGRTRGGPGPQSMPAAPSAVGAPHPPAPTA